MTDVEVSGVRVLHQMLGVVFDRVFRSRYCVVFALLGEGGFTMQSVDDYGPDIEDICGDLSDLQGSPILVAEETSGETEGVSWTFYRFATVRGTVTIRWGEPYSDFYSDRIEVVGEGCFAPIPPPPPPPLAQRGEMVRLSPTRFNTPRPSLVTGGRADLGVAAGRPAEGYRCLTEGDGSHLVHSPGAFYPELQGSAPGSPNRRVDPATRRLVPVPSGRVRGVHAGHGYLSGDGHGTPTPQSSTGVDEREDFPPKPKTGFGADFAVKQRAWMRGES